MIFIQFKHPRVGFNLLFHADLPVGIDLGQPPKNALHSWCFFYSCPAIFEVPLYLIIDRTSDSCGILISSRHLFVHFVLPFSIKGPPRSPLLLICQPFGFFISLQINRQVVGGFFPDLYPSVNLFGHAAISEMIKLQFTTITDRIRNKTGSRNLA